MPTYEFEAMDATGMEIKDTIVAESEVDAQSTIRQMGYFVTKIGCKSEKKREKKWTGKTSDEFRQHAEDLWAAANLRPQHTSIAGRIAGRMLIFGLGLVLGLILGLLIGAW